MNDHENRRFQMFVRARDFGAAHASDFANGSLGNELFTNLTTIVLELTTHAASEVSGLGSARQGTSTRAQARAALREDLVAIRRTAREMSKDIPGISDKFRIPRNTNDLQLLSAARAFVTDATPLRAQFVAHEMPADFLDDLNADISALETAISNQSSGVGDHVAARASIDDAIDRGVDTVQRLNAIVKNKYSNNVSVLAEWASASHTERAPRSKQTTTTPPPPPSTSAGSTPPPA